MKTQSQELIKKLQKNEDVLQFALPEGSRGFVKKNGELLLCIGGSIVSFGHFENYLGDDGTLKKYYFVYQNGGYDIPKEIHSQDEELTKDLYAFAIKLGYFFNQYPSYKCMREYDWDVLSDMSPRQFDTPLAKAGFRVEDYPTC
jgi:hypothetical protein